MTDLGWLRDLLVVPVLTMARMTTCIIVVPFFSNNLITGPVRNGIIISLSLVLFPMVAPTLPERFDSLLQVVVIVAKEILLGVLLGFLAGAPFWIADSVGFFVDNQRGTGMASLFDPELGEQTSPLGSLLLQLLITLFYTGGGFLLFLGMMYESYRIMPILTFFPVLNEEFPVYFLAFVDKITGLTVVLAAPMVIAMFLVDLGLGLVNRFAPSLNVFFLSMPIKSALSMAILVVYVMTLMVILSRHLITTRQLHEFFRLVSPGG